MRGAAACSHGRACRPSHSQQPKAAPASCAPTLHTAATNKVARSSIAVQIARRPACTAAAGASCLAVSPASGPATSTFTVTAAGFAADSDLAYDFGVQRADGRRDFFARSSADARYAFAPRALKAGTQTLFVCARGRCWGLCEDEGALALLPGVVAVLQRPAFLLLWPALHDRCTPTPLSRPQTSLAPRPAPTPLWP